MRPDLSGALFVEHSGTKKRERRAEMCALTKIYENEKERLPPAFDEIY